MQHLISLVQPYIAQKASDCSDAYICFRYSRVYTVAETIDRPVFYHRNPMLRNHYSCSQKTECVLAMRISNLGIAFFTRHIVVLDYIASFIIAIYFVLLTHLFYRVAILVVEFSRVFIKDIGAFLIGYILKLTLIGNIYRG